ncbi:MAG: bifunctional pyr operon transcriptional regulator/uracil phosphoribosyltransferase PyrR [Coriobacteriales bacterium]
MDSPVKVKSVCMSASEIDRAVTRMSHQILEANQSLENLVLVGIVTRGDVLAERIARAIERIEGVRLPLGCLDISFYRDDVATYLAPTVHATEIAFSIDGKDVVLVDDVLYTGRTVRAALDALRDIGRPATVQLSVLVDRGHRQLPIRADYVGKNIPSARNESVRAYLEEVDGFSEVQIQEAADGARIGSAPLRGVV